MLEVRGPAWTPSTAWMDDVSPRGIFTRAACRTGGEPVDPCRSHLGGHAEAPNGLAATYGFACVAVLMAGGGQRIHRPGYSVTLACGAERITVKPPDPNYGSFAPRQ
jgi:hypothetical protein